MAQEAIPGTPNEVPQDNDDLNYVITADGHEQYEFTDSIGRRGVCRLAISTTGEPIIEIGVGRLEGTLFLTQEKMRKIIEIEQYFVENGSLLKPPTEDPSATAQE